MFFKIFPSVKFLLEVFYTFVYRNKYLVTLQN